ncbi:MAG: helix-turn-helix transcriptional regulator [Chloroflexi bacterium]|nr:helix-turn-helix transcriptional regulator [Chloroflexota bacterium]MCC6893267.1 helix-turn-helix transcriptional regulator [Anaerolineae bacterium]
MSILDKQLITNLRKQKGWEQKDLAEAAGINPAVVSRLERGIQTDFKLSIIVAIANALDVEVDDLLQKNDNVSRISRLHPQLQSSLSRLSNYPLSEQKLIAAIIDAFLKEIESESQNAN